MTAASDAKSVDVLVNIDVEDLAAGIRFYVDGLGFRLERRLFEGTVAQLGGAAVPVFLLQKRAGTLPGPGVATVRSYQRHWTAVHLDIAVDAIEAAVERAVRAGARLESAIASYAWGRQALMSDPFGHGFCLLQWSPAGYDAVDCDARQPRAFRLLKGGRRLR